jgi:hypothetical protein
MLLVMPPRFPLAWRVVVLLVAIAPPALAQDLRSRTSPRSERERKAHHHPRPRPHHQRGPSPARIRRAIAAAERSRGLWATVNVCNTRRYPHMIGIRGQIPALGFATELSMRIQIEYWSEARSRFQRDPYASTLVRLGAATHGFYQRGVIYLFRQPLLLRAAVTFRWRYQGRLLARVTRHTGSGYRPVDYSDPPGYSHATCRIT